MGEVLSELIKCNNQLVQSQTLQAKALGTIARQSRKRVPDHDRDHLAPDSDHEVDDFDWSEWLKTAGIPEGSLRSLAETGYLDVPKHIGKMLRDARELPSGVPFISAQHVSWWEPPYIIQNLPADERRKLQSIRRASNDLGPFLGNVATWGLAHSAAGSFTLRDLFVYFLNLLRLQDEYGAGFVKRYHDRLVENIQSSIRGGHKFEIGPLLTVRQKEVIMDLRIKTQQAPPSQDPLLPRSEYRFPTDGAGRRPKGGKGLRTHPPPASIPPVGGKGGKGGRKAVPGKVAGQLAVAALEDRPVVTSGIGKLKGGKGKPSKGRPPVCLDHDHRQGLHCQTPNCTREHLDTSQAPMAARFDAAHSAATRNKGRGK